MRHIAVVKTSIVDEALNWAKSNCPGYITNDHHMYGYNAYDPTKYDFFFATEKDLAWFLLRWG